MWIDDQIIKQCSQPQVLETWVPQSPCVILGSANRPERECQVGYCQRAGIDILKRYGGGGTVLLHSGCVILSYGCWVKQTFDNHRYFQILNKAIVDTLGSRWPEFKSLHQKGISDIAYELRKVCGTSLFRSKSYLLFQASILVESKVEEIEAALLHPSREPDYREGKAHREFLLGLQDIDTTANTSEVKLTLHHGFLASIKNGLREDFVPPNEKHIPYLLKRAGLK